MQRGEIPGVGFREAYFTPTFSKYLNKVCGGVQVHVTDPARFDPMRVAVEMLVAAKAIYADFAWRVDNDPRPYWIDKLSGSTRLREQVDRRRVGRRGRRCVGRRARGVQPSTQPVPPLPRPRRLT